MENHSTTIQAPYEKKADLCVTFLGILKFGQPQTFYISTSLSLCIYEFLLDQFLFWCSKLYFPPLFISYLPFCFPSQLQVISNLPLLHLSLSPASIQSLIISPCFLAILDSLSSLIAPLLCWICQLFIPLYPHPCAPSSTCLNHICKFILQLIIIVFMLYSSTLWQKLI